MNRWQNAAMVLGGSLWLTSMVLALGMPVPFQGQAKGTPASATASSQPSGSTPETTDHLPAGLFRSLMQPEVLALLEFSEDQFLALQGLQYQVMHWALDLFFNLQDEEMLDGWLVLLEAMADEWAMLLLTPEQFAFWQMALQEQPASINHGGTQPQTQPQPKTSAGGGR